MTCWAMTNRCDSIDALMYAYYEFMKNKEENQMLEKDKNCIEFSMRSMMATHKPYQEDTEIAITGMAPGKSLLLANNPFDIPCDVVVVSKRYFERLQTGNEQLRTENEELKKKLQVPDPFAEYKELFEKLRSKEDIEKFEWTLNHVCGGQASANGWMVTAKLWRRNYETLSKLVGFSSKKEVEDYLVNEAECDTLYEAISKLKDQVKYTCDEWYSANSRNNSWKAAAECNSPKELIEKRETLEKEIEVYSRTLKDWKEGTGCPSPSAAKTLIENGPTRIIYLNDPIGVIEKWQKVTGYDRPEDFLKWKANIEGIMEAWKGLTGCKYPGEAEKRIQALIERIDESEACYNHLLALTGFGSEGEIEDALDQCDHSTLRKALVDYEFDYEELLKLTGYKSNQDIRVALNHSEQFVYESMMELINSLKRQAKFTNLNWQKATGCETPEGAELNIRRLRGRIDEMKEFAAIASNWTDRIVED